jgi:WD40 repeat protein
MTPGTVTPWSSSPASDLRPARGPRPALPWDAQAQVLTADRKLPALLNKWPLPDLPGPALRRTLGGHTGPVRAVAIAPDGIWLASAGLDGSVRIWDPATGGISALMRVDSRLQDCAWSPSSQSLAAAGSAGLYHFTFKP